MNSSQVNILHVEDIRSDADLVKREMKHSQLSFEWLWVATKADYEHALLNFAPDIILCDHSLPEFTSTEAFNLLKKSGLKIPFILITATISEEFAVMMMRQGIADYILKDRMQRLPTAVSSALEKRQSRVEKEAYMSEIVMNEKKFRGLIENSHDLILLLNPKLNLIYASPNSKRITGWEAYEMVRTGTSAYVHEQDRQGMNATILKALQTPGKYVPITFRLYNQAGQIIDLDGTVINLINDESINGLIINIRDITQRNKTQASLQRSEANLNAIIENSDVHIYSLDRNFRYITFNSLLKNTMKQMYGLDLEVGQRVFDLFSKLDPVEGHEWEARYREALSGKSLQFVKEFKVGEFNSFTSFSVNPIVQNDEITGLSCFARDVTAEKLADEKVRQSEARFRALSEKNAEMTTLSNSKGELIYGSPSITKGLGYSLEEFLSKPPSELIHPDDALSPAEVFEKLQTPDKSFFMQQRLRHKNGSWIWCEGFVTNLLDEPDVNALVSNFRDITEKKKAEQQKEFDEKKIRDSEKRYRDTLDNMVEGCQIVDFNWRYVYVNLSAALQSQNTTDAMVGKTVMEVYPGFENTNIFTEFKNCMDNRVEKQFESNFIFPDGTSGVFHIHVLPSVEGIFIQSHDISVRKKAEQVLKEYNERYDIVSKATNDAIWDWDIQRDVMTWNHGLESIFGYPDRQVVGAHAWWKQRIHDEDYDQVTQLIQKCSEDTCVNWSATYRFKCANGEVKHVLDRAYIIYQDDKPVRMIGAMQDVTERIESIKEIEKLSLVASKTSSAVTITDKLGRVEWVNNGFTEITGYTLDESKGRDMNFLQGPETNPLTVRRISAALKRNEPVSEELINYSKQGKKFWLKLEITPIFSKDGSLRNFISIQSDITKIKEYENSIVSIARELAGLIENANVPIFGIDMDGRINEWNRVAAELTGLDKREAFGSILSTLLFDAETLTGFDVVLENLKKGISTGNLEFPVITKDKRRLALLMSASARLNTTGQIVGGIFVAQNITELTEYRSNLEVKVTERTRELNEALSKERELVDMKSRFISIASHEFRTPLATISIATGLIRKYHAKLSQEEIEEKLQNIQKQVDHMSYMLDDVLLIEKANAGKLTVQKTEIDLLDFFTNLASEVQKSSGNTHTIKITKNILRNTVQSDEKIMRSIFINLFTNAIKFSPGQKYVDVNISSTSISAVLSVKDYGVGIPEADIKNLFEPFFRGSNVSAIQGTGLGLSIIRKSLELVKGTISVKSVVGKGTEFTITLPS